MTVIFAAAVLTRASASWFLASATIMRRYGLVLDYWILSFSSMSAKLYNITAWPHYFLAAITLMPQLWEYGLENLQASSSLTP
jgi:hypothetical protein